MRLKFLNNVNDGLVDCDTLRGSAVKIKRKFSYFEANPMISVNSPTYIVSEKVLRLCSPLTMINSLPGTEN